VTKAMQDKYVKKPDTFKCNLMKGFCLRWCWYAVIDLFLDLEMDAR